MEDTPLKAIRKKKDSSIVRGLEALKEGKISFFFSPGNTGSLIYGASQIIGLINDIQSPAIAVLVPNIHGDVLLLDAGASFLMDEERGVELAVMGKIFYENFFSSPNPPVGILNIGKEWYKGPKWVRRLNSFFKKEDIVNYYGYVEGFDLFTSRCRVFVTGGYTGNILLKGLEGVYYYLRNALGGSKESGGILDAVRNQIHYSRIGAGILMGIRKDVFVGHGITSGEALNNALFFAKKIYKLNLTSQIEREIGTRGFLSKWLKRRKI
jgi:glycerol-3-phosphate acyltransferase PlsX